MIEVSIRHQLSQGVDEILIADNRSDDGTLELLRALSTSLPIHIATDQLVAYHQAEKMTQLARAVDRLGASFVIPFDADEFWFAESGTVVDFLRANRADVVRARIHNIFPLADLLDGIDQTTQFRIDLSAHKLGKVAFRSSAGTVLHMGNHGVHRSGRRSDGLVVAHLPWRSYEQLRRKTTIGGAALDAAGVPAEVGSHWRSMAVATDATVHTTWSAILAGEQADIGWGPRGPFGLGAVLGWNDWSRVSTVEKERREP